MKSLKRDYWIAFWVYSVITIGSVLLMKLIQIPSYRLNEALIPKTFLLFCGFMIVLVYFVKIPRIHRIKEWISVLILGFFLTVFTVFLLRNTYYGFNGVENDVEFITASVTRYANSWTFHDFSYQDLSGFYPPLYFYILGKVAWLTGIEPYMMVRYGLFAVCFFLPPLFFLAWSKVIRPQFALFFTFALIFVYPHTPFALYYKAYEFIALSFIVPWWFAFAEPLKGTPTERKKYLRFLFVGGILGAIIFQVYYYWFFAFIIYTAIQLVIDLFRKQTWKEVFKKYSHTFYVLLLTGAFSMLYILPMVLDFLTVAFNPVQNKYFYFDMLNIEPKITADIEGLVLLISLFTIFIFSQKRKFVSKLLLLLLSIYIWQFVGHVGLTIDKPNLHFKMKELLYYVLMAGFSYLMYMVTTSKRFREYRKTITVAVLVLIVIIFGQKMLDVKDHRYNRTAQNSYVPPEVKTLQQFDYKNKVVLSVYNKLHTYLPVFDFFSHEVLFSHHSAQREERLVFLRDLGQSQNPEFVAWMLTYNKYDKVDYIWMPKPKEGSATQILKNNILVYPDGKLRIPINHYPDLKHVYIKFNQSIYQAPYFKQLKKGETLYEIQGVTPDQYDQFTAEEKDFADQYMNDQIKVQLHSK
ncbi:arabinofuranosyltransferase [Risungbinella massiliensis]|uniref:arabinofuranosyltransferase n=1 Tax=Risungbinella massiliensis TaxID=1329796 RepID=UPI0005CC8B33|nr:arabinofuranosyltransferase [Risungbinella massiliensis]